jgi:hypothetical protein
LSIGTERPMLTEETPGIEAIFCTIARPSESQALRGIGDLGVWNIEAECLNGFDALALR